MIRTGCGTWGGGALGEGEWYVQQTDMMLSHSRMCDQREAGSGGGMLGAGTQGINQISQVEACWVSMMHVHGRLACMLAQVPG